MAPRGPKTPVNPLFTVTEKPVFALPLPDEANQIVAYSYENDQAVSVTWELFAASFEDAVSFVRRAAAKYVTADGTRVGATLRKGKGADEGKLIVVIRPVTPRPRKPKAE